MIIKKAAFVPSPKVDSAIVLLTRKENEQYDPKFYQFLRPFFLAKRKKLLNNLPPYIKKEDMLSHLVEFGFDENVRAEMFDYNQ